MQLLCGHKQVQGNTLAISGRPHRVPAACAEHTALTPYCVYPERMGAEHIALSPCCVYPEGSLCLEVEGWEPPETRAVRAISTWTRLNTL